MPASRYFACALLALVLAAVSTVYGMWLWIIQTSGDAYYHYAGMLVFAAFVLFVIGLFRRR